MGSAGQRVLGWCWSRRALAGRVTLWSAVFVIAAFAYGLTIRHAPPFQSNQNTKMTHALGLLGVGHLEHDWLVNTTNPFPPWAVLCAGLYGLWEEVGFYVGSFAVGGAFVVGLTLLATGLRGWPERKAGRWARLGVVVMVFCLLVVSHSQWWKREGLPGKPGKGEPPHGWVMEQARQWVSPVLRDWGGVAGQGAMAGEFQPSVFGAMLVLGLGLFAHGRHKLAAASIALGAVFHPTYLITAGALMAGMLLVLAVPFMRGPPVEPTSPNDEAEGDEAKDDGVSADAPPPRPGRHLLVVLAVFLVPTGLMLLYTWWSFGATSPALKAEADAILAQFRIPHHAMAERWLFREQDGLPFGFKAEVWRKLLLVAAAPLLAWRWRLSLPIGFALFVGVALTWIAIAYDSHRLMLIAPWRVSATLVPIALAILIGRIVQAWCWLLYGLTFALLPELRPVVRLGLIPALHIGLLVWVAWPGWGNLQQTLDRYEARNDWPMFHAVRAEANADDVYLVSARWLDFRLKARVPIVVTHKSHPIKDTEVLDWKDRLEAVLAFDRAKDETTMRAALNRLVADYGVTRIALRKRGKHPKWLRPDHAVVYEDERFIIFDASPMPEPAASTPPPDAS